MLDQAPKEEKQVLKIIWPGRTRPCAFLDTVGEEQEVLVHVGGLVNASWENTTEANTAVRICSLGFDGLMSFLTGPSSVPATVPVQGPREGCRSALSLRRTGGCPEESCFSGCSCLYRC
jgi:hypothetical protein